MDPNLIEDKKINSKLIRHLNVKHEIKNLKRKHGWIPLWPGEGKAFPTMIQKQKAIEEKTDHFGHIKLKRKNKTKPFA